MALELYTEQNKIMDIKFIGGLRLQDAQDFDSFASVLYLFCLINGEAIFFGEITFHFFRIMKFQDFFPETYRLDVREEREMFCETYQGRTD